MRLSLVAAGAFALLCSPVVSLADVVELGALKDNTLYQNVNGTTSNGAGQYFFVGRSDDGDLKRGVIAFDIAAHVPAGATINDVQLTLHLSKTRVAVQNIVLRRLLKDWGEGTSNASSNEGSGAPATPGDATWKHTFYPSQLWDTLGGDFATTDSAATEVNNIGFYTWGSTAEMVADVQMWLETPNTNFGWLLLGNEKVRSAKRFDTKENPTALYRPLLRIEFETVTVLLGDLNCDAKVDFGDINPFVLRLSDPGGYAQQFPDCPDANGDINEDGRVDFADINPFVALLTQPEE